MNQKILFVSWILGLILICPHLLTAQTIQSAEMPGYLGMLAGDLPAETYPDATNRQRQLLNGTWSFQFDTLDVGMEESWFNTTQFEDWDQIVVPGAWDLNHPKGFDRQTVGWYGRKFSLKNKGELHKLVFSQAFRSCDVWLNGELLGHNDLPYLPFAFDITAKLRTENVLIVRVDNRIEDFTLPSNTQYNPGKHGWFPYGGLIGEVYLESGRATYVAQTVIRTDLEGKVTAGFLIHNANQKAKGLECTVALLGPRGAKINLTTIPVPSETGYYEYIYQVKQPKLWSPITPGYRYKLKISLTKPLSQVVPEYTEYAFGFKQFEARDGKFYLNQKPIFLKGINRHQDHPESGPVYHPKVISQDMALIKKLKANFIRPGHYPNDPRNLQAFEAAGLMIVEEVPVYQFSKTQFTSEELNTLAQEALLRMIIRDINRPGIVMWSLSNEIRYWPKSSADFTDQMAKAAKKIDPERPVMHARLTLPKALDALLKDRSSEYVDVIGINIYAGWYYGNLKQVPKFLARYRKRFPDKTLMLSEFGAGAVQGRQAKTTSSKEPRKNHSYSEDFQLRLHKQYLDIVKQTPAIQGVMPWVFADFRMQWSPNTGKPHPVPLTNLKGLVNGDRVPKSAFQLYQKFYSQYNEKQRK